MPPTKHAILGASSAHRWLACTPSAQWERGFGEDKPSEAAEEGTLAHAIAEHHLGELLKGRKPETPSYLKSNRLYRPVMEEHVAVYTDYIMEKYTEACVKTPDTILCQEQRVDYSQYAPGGFGTADCLMISDGTLHVFDFKYGKGVPVFAEGNPQIRLYALGALGEFSLLYDISTVVVHIIQPRLDSITSESLPVEDLKTWGEEYVKPRAALAAKGEGEFVAGEHCTFCKCRYKCRTLAEYNLSIGLKQYREPDHEEVYPNEMTPDDIADVLDRVDSLTRWAKGVKDYALDQAVNHGVSYPRYKVVEGRANRQIRDEASVIDKLDGIGFTADRVTRLKPLGDLEDLIGKKKLAETLGDLIIKPQGKPVLAKETDRRPAIQSNQDAHAVFTELEDEDE